MAMRKLVIRHESALLQAISELTENIYSTCFLRCVTFRLIEIIEMHSLTQSLSQIRVDSFAAYAYRKKCENLFVSIAFKLRVWGKR